MYLGMTQTEADDISWRGTTEGGKLKETGTVHWLSPNTGATNESGFFALPGEYRSYNGSFGSVGENADFWSASENNSSTAWYRGIGHNHSDVVRKYAGKRYGFSVRCVKD